MPHAIEQLDLSGYDLIISSSHAVAKGVLTGPDQLHISYVHSPIRYAWDLQHQYLKEAGLDRGLKGKLARVILHYVRIWDQRTAAGVDAFVANSHFIARRISKAYRREAKVIYPPVDISRFTPSGGKEDFYLTASRMVPYKRMPMIVEAFSSMPDKKLVVIGAGPEFEKAKEVAGPNVTLLGYQDFDCMLDTCAERGPSSLPPRKISASPPSKPRPAVPPSSPMAGVASWKPCAALDAQHPTGVFYPEQTAASLCAAVRQFEALKRRSASRRAGRMPSASPPSASVRKCAPLSRPGSLRCICPPIWIWRS